MAKNKTRIADATRCLMCYQPICDIACQKKVFPAGIIHALHLKNEAGAYLRSAENVSCLHCDDAKCEKACARGRVDSPIRIQETCRYVSQMKNISRESTQAELSVNFCGIRCENPFFLASSPVASSFEMCCHAFDAGWAGVSYKTISFYQSREVSPRFDALPGEHPFSFCGFKNLEQLSPHSAEENFEIIRRLKERYPEKVIIASIMGRNCDEWTVLARMAEEAGADLIECNFSCPQMAKQGLGSDIGQDQDLIALYTRATRKGSRLPIIAKMTPNIGNMELPAMTAIANGANSLAAINTVKSITRINTENFSSYPDIGGQSAVGGYSGQAVKPIALRFIRDLASYPPLKGIPLFGIGGITTWQDALDFILLGCTALQVCTSVMEYGYRIIDHLKEGLSIYMKQHDIASLDELRGLALPNLVQPEQLDRERKLHCEIDSRRCIHCGRCYISCLDGGHQAIGWEKRTPMIDKSLCVGCGLCTLVCPTEAISLVNSL